MCIGQLRQHLRAEQPGQSGDGADAAFCARGLVIILLVIIINILLVVIYICMIIVVRTMQMMICVV